MATEQQKINAWQKAKPVEGYSASQIRVDDYGSVILWSEYGKQTEYGWEIDHELPQNGFPGLSTLFTNQRALHWRNNRSKGDKIGIDTLLRGL